uniref:Uncharacterized protein n=1 Tax=Cacopsylla melanoneura TaxID=428564 RepID=A0A8D8LMY6_9HEMI
MSVMNRSLKDPFVHWFWYHAVRYLSKTKTFGFYILVPSRHMILLSLMIPAHYPTTHTNQPTLQVSKSLQTGDSRQNFNTLRFHLDKAFQYKTLSWTRYSFL